MIVVIPYANNPLDLSVLLMQLQCQRVKPKEIFLADNSADGSGVKIAERYQWSVPIATMRNVGTIYESWNKGIEYALSKDETVAVVNDDILIPWDFVATMEEYAKTGGALMYCPDVDGSAPVGKVRKHYEFYSKSDLDYRLLDHQEYSYPPSLKGWCFVITKETREKIGLFDTQFKVWYGDKDYEARIFNAGGKVCFIKGMNVHHYGTSSYMKIDKDVFKKSNLEDQLAYEKKYNIEHENVGWG